MSIVSRVNFLTALAKATNTINYIGYRQFINEDGEPYGSFEVFYWDGYGEAPTKNGKPGYYWHSCYPGCIPDSEASGPFPTAEAAFNDARSE